MKEPSFGLLCSMSLRYDHAFWMRTDAEKAATLAEMKTAWDQYAANDFVKPDGFGTVVQLWEEASGNGFWSPENDLSYVESFEKSKGSRGLRMPWHR